MKLAGWLEVIFQDNEEGLGIWGKEVVSDPTLEVGIRTVAACRASPPHR